MSAALDIAKIVVERIYELYDRIMVGELIEVSRELGGPLDIRVGTDDVSLIWRSRGAKDDPNKAIMESLARKLLGDSYVWKVVDAGGRPVVRITSGR